MKPVRIYTTTYCGYCRSAKALLDRKGVAYEEFDITDDDAKRAELLRITGQRTVPQIFIGEKHIGGFSDLDALERAGELDALLAA